MIKKAEVSSFFLSGNCEDDAYRNIRDIPRYERTRKFIEELWCEYRPYADRHFQIEAQSQFLQRFWEMYVCVTFRHHGFDVEKVSNEGPEFLVQIGDYRLWVEAIAPNQGDTEDRVPSLEFDTDVACKVPKDKVLLRYTSALFDKLKNYNKSCENGLIKAADGYILAINSRNIPHGSFNSVYLSPDASQLPYFVQALLPFGNLAKLVDQKPSESTEGFYQHSDHVVKQSGEQISTQPFLEPEYAGISAVIHSAVDYVNYPLEFGADFDVLHNPLAKCPLPEDSLAWCTQRTYNNGKIETIEPNLKLSPEMQ